VNTADTGSLEVVWRSMERNSQNHCLKWLCPPNRPQTTTTSSNFQTTAGKEEIITLEQIYHRW